MKNKYTIIVIALLGFAMAFTACQKKPEGEITVTTNAITDIKGNSAVTGGTVTSVGYTIGECGVCYNTYSYPTLEDCFTQDREGNGEFSSTLSDLKMGTKYYVRAYAKTSSRIEYGEERTFTTHGGYTVEVFISPTSSGTVTGAGTYLEGQSCTVTATAKDGYTFTNWTESGTVLSSNSSYTFTVSKNRDIQANFSKKKYTVTVSAEPSDGGVVDGGGEYQYGSSCTVTATPNHGYDFTNWTENGKEVSTNASYTFTVNGNRTLKANFATAVPTGTWLYYDDDVLDETWGYGAGGTLEWAVMFPPSMVGPYVGMKITEVMVYAGAAGRYYFNIYSGGSTPTTQVFSGYSDLDHAAWWTISLHSPVDVTAKNLWITVNTTHEAGNYPAGSSAGSNNPNARWVNWGSHGWCDAYTEGWSDADLTWIIRAHVTDGNKSYEIGASQDEASTYQCEPAITHALQEKIKQYGKQRPTKQKGIFQRSR